MDVQTVSIVIAAVSVVIGVINSIMSNQKADQQRQTEIDTRQAELFMQVYQRFNTREFRQALQNVLYIQEYRGWDEFLQQYGSLEGG
jgi:type II secretory pathway pseudopilin PulG